MSSAGQPPVLSEDRSTQARIRDEALRLFGELGFRATTVRAIAAAVGVSPALVLHHFGSKEGLRASIDAHVADVIRDGKLNAMTGGFTISADEYEEAARLYKPYMDYLARSLMDDGPAGQHMYDRMHADAMAYLAAGVEAGVINEAQDVDARAAVLLNMSLANLLLAKRTMSVLGSDDLLAMHTRTAGPVLDLFTDGVFTDDRFRQMLNGLSQDQAETQTDIPRPEPGE